MNRFAGRNRFFSFLLLAVACAQIVACGSHSKPIAPGTAPAITSANNATFVVGQAGTFTVTATGTPAPTFALTGALPTGVTFATATGILSGTPAIGSNSSYPLVITATNAAGAATQNFTLTVETVPVITSANNTAFAIGAAGTFTVTATGSPAPTLAQTGALPAGVTFDPVTGILSGTPPNGTSGAYPLVITATNAAGAATQNFTLTVGIVPAITSANNAAFIIGAAGTFTVTVTGTPAPTLSQTGALPAGVTFDPVTGILSGTPANGTSGTYPLVITASNAIGAATQNFTLTVGIVPVITSANNTTFRIGAAGTFTVTATGTPAPTLAQTGTLPTGVTFDPVTGILSGTPAIGSSGAYPLVITATNTVGVATQNLTLTVRNEFSYNSNSSSNDISAFSVDPTTGALTPIAGSPFAGGSEPNSVGIDPSGRFLYASNESTSSVLPSTVSGYTIDPATGALTPIAGSPFAAGIEPNTARVHPSGKFLYVPNEGDQTISAYAIDSTTGALTPIAGSPFATGATGNTDSIAMNPAGTFAYVSQNSSPGAVLGFAIDTTTGALTPVAGSPFTTGTNSDFTFVDPTGKFLYVANFGSMDVSGFTINSSTGALTPIAGSPFATGGGRPDAVAVDPSGKFLYAADDSGVAALAGFTIDATTGALTLIAGSPFVAGNSPSGVAVDPSGKFAFSANENSGDISVFSINPATGALTNVPGSPFPAGTEPGGIVVF